MSNMDYCRFHNTVIDLEECADYVAEMNLSEEENKARIRLIRICISIAEDFYDEENLEECFKQNGKEF